MSLAPWWSAAEFDQSHLFLDLSSGAIQGLGPQTRGFEFPGRILERKRHFDIYLLYLQVLAFCS
jgi:hypothetical protein